MKHRHFFLNGLPHIGKTTALIRIVQSLDRAYGITARAFVTGAGETGLDMVTSSNRKFKIASSNTVSKYRVGKYFVNPAAIEEAMQDLLTHQRNARYIYLDEIGTLFCQSPFFIRTVRSLLTTHTLIGVIAKKGHPFINEIHQRSDCYFTEITSDNRDHVPNTILTMIQSI